MLADYQRLMMHWHKRDEVPEVASDAMRETAFDLIERDITRAYVRSQSSLAAELLGRVHAHEPAFFEGLVIDVLLAMGYGGRRRDLARKLGRSGDGGVDGVIAMDELGLDLVYLQAKRLKPGSVVPISEVRDFAGSLDAYHAGKGIFVATSHFSPAAVSFCRQVSRRVILVDGMRFAEMMIRHNVGVRVKQSFQLKRVDPEYFRRDPARAEDR
ncbi:MAG: restriction endonuclease [Rhizobiales bacterium]|nr:restriction endonuclease [Hyphomicrobiales bacterium]MBI3673510.1 restriction endonuclease [Hyphomicrobiales bacterium]